VLVVVLVLNRIITGDRLKNYVILGGVIMLTLHFCRDHGGLRLLSGNSESSCRAFTFSGFQNRQIVDVDDIFHCLRRIKYIDVSIVIKQTFNENC
jgi:hypothetical protein